MLPQFPGETRSRPDHVLVWCFLAIFLSWATPSRGDVRTVIQVPAAATDTQIQKILNGLPAEGGEVVLAPGFYEIRHPLRLDREGLTLRGSGTNTVLHLADNANCPVVILGLVDVSAGKAVAHLVLADLVIDGNRNHQSVEGWADAANTSNIQNDGVIVQSVTDSEVARVTCAHCRSGGLVTANEVRRLTVRDFTAFDNEFDGLACYRTEDSLFTGLNLHHNRAAGISLDLGFNRNTISHSVLAANDLGIFMREARDNQFAGLVIRQSRHDGVFMAQAGVGTPAGWQYTPNTECTGNHFSRLDVSGCGGVAFRVNDSTCIDNRIQGARFERNTGGGLTTARTNLVTVEALVLREL